MLSNQDILSIDQVLSTCSTATMTQQEIDFLNAINESVTNDCDHYRIAQMVIVEREKLLTVKTVAPDRVIKLASANGCDLSPKSTKGKTSVIGMIGGRIDC